MVSLTSQLSELKTPALALAGASSMWGDSEATAVTSQPSRIGALSPSSWGSNGNGPSLEDAALPAGLNPAQRDPVHAETAATTPRR